MAAPRWPLALIGDAVESNLPRALGDGLVLRRATAADLQLAAFHAAVHSDAGPQSPDEGVGDWVRDLLSGAHPTVQPGDFALVEEARSGDIISSLCLISQTWTYGGLPFAVGRPELVGTRSDYRRRGLVRAQFDLIHEWGTQRRHRMQAITGIPNYYRQFGYEMALELGGGRAGYGAQVPKLPEGEAEPYRVRPATEGDLRFIQELYEAGCRRSLVACLRDEALWHYEIVHRRANDVERREICTIETEAGTAVGFLAHPAGLWRQSVYVVAYELKPGVSWLAVTPTVVRYLWRTGEAYAGQVGQGCPDALVFGLGTEHPVYRAFARRLPQIRPPYAWYLRVPDLPGFLRQIAPVLERRLAESVVPGYSGELRISFYRDGLRLAFHDGRLTCAESWRPESGEENKAAFPDLTFLQLLFGYRSLEELKYAFRDCWTDGDEAPVLLEALFPKQPSGVWPVG